jgi:hypothetical protein
LESKSGINPFGNFIVKCKCASKSQNSFGTRIINANAPKIFWSYCSKRKIPPVLNTIKKHMFYNVLTNILIFASTSDKNESRAASQASQSLFARPSILLR